MSRPPIRYESIFGCVFLLTMCGCSDRLATYPVQGKVVFPSGSPVRVGSIEIRSKNHNIQARGTISRDGSFELSTYEPGDGAVEGKHDCVIVQMVMTEGIEGHRPSTLGVIDRRYASYRTSGLSIEIKPTDENEIVVEVEPIKARKMSSKDREHAREHEREDSEQESLE